MTYLIRRVAHGVFLLFGVSLLSFVLVQIAPGDFFEEMRLDPRISPQTVDTLRAQYGLDRSFPVRYFHWVKSLLNGDLGFSFAYGSPVAPILGPRVCHTLVLTLSATAIAWMIAVPLGLWSAVRKGRWADRLCAAGTSVLLAIPDLVLALGLLLLALRTGLFPAGGMRSVGYSELGSWARVRDLASHLVLPCAALAMSALPVLLRHVRAAVVEVSDAPFVRTALAHGIPSRRILWRHVLPAAANPLISLFGVSVGSLLSASLLVEVIMGWPGLGPLTLEAIFARDFYLVVGSVIFSALFLVAGNLLADVLLYAVDPRIRKE